MRYLTYDLSGSITGVYVTFAAATAYDEQSIKVDTDVAEQVLARPDKFKVEQGQLIPVEVKAVPEVPRFDESSLSAGVVVDGVCYAVTPFALGLMAAGLAAGKAEALVYTPRGDKLVSVDQLTVRALISATHQKINDALT